MLTTSSAVSPETLAPYGLGEAIQLGISGISIVLIALCLLAVFIVIMGKVIGAMEKKPVAEVSAPVVETPVEKAVPANLMPDNRSEGDINLFDVDDKTAAMLMAIVADTSGIPLNELYFRSIREVK